MDVSNTPEIYVTELGEITNLSDIYRQIAVEPNPNFDDTEQKDMLVTFITECYDKEFLMIDSEILVRDVNKLNLSFVKYVKYSAEEPRNFKNVSAMFIAYCDFFNIPYHACYKNLHDKLKTLILNGYKRMIGMKEFNKVEKRLNPNKVQTLFDLFGTK